MNEIAPTIHFFIPVYFDIESFLILRERVSLVLPFADRAFFHLLDDSAGQDPQIQLARELPCVSVVSMPCNLGHQRALVHGLRQFILNDDSDSLVVTMDGDGEDRPEDLPRLLEAYRSANKKFAIVLAKRTKRKESIFLRFFISSIKMRSKCLRAR